MTRARVVQNTFSGGEIDPKLYARNDFQRFKTGMSRARGFIPLRQGAITRAPGTIYQGTTRLRAPGRLIPFQFAEDDALELEFTDLRMRVWRYGALVMDGGSPFEIVTPYTTADLPNLDWAQDGDVIYMVDGRQPMQKLSRFALDDWTIAPVDFERGPFRPQNFDETKTIRVTVVSSGATLWEADEVLTIGDQRRYGRNTYTFQGVASPTTDPLADGTCGPRAPTHVIGDRDYTWEVETTPTLGDPETYRTDRVRWTFVSASASIGNVTLAGTGDPFTTDMVGALLRIEPVDFNDLPSWVGNTKKRNGKLVTFGGNVYRHVDGNSSGVNPPTHAEGSRMTDGDKKTIYQYVSDLVGIVRITAVTDANTATGEILREIPQPCIDDPSYRWAIGAWSDTFGYPSSVTIHEQRLFAAGTPTEPRTLWASQIGDFEDFLPGIAADAPFAFTIETGGQKNRILWLTSGRRGLFIGSLGQVIRAFSGSDREAIGPTTFDTEIVANDGVSAARPIAPEGDPLYVVRGGARVQEIKYSFEVDGSRPIDLSLPSEHLCENGIQQIVWQGEPMRIAWMRDTAGRLLAMIYDPAQEVLGWAVVPLAGGIVEDLCVTRSADGSADILTMIVLRTLNGESPGLANRYVERMSLLPQALDSDPDALGAFNHLYCALEYDGASTSTLTVTHLWEEFVNVWTPDGRILPEDGSASGFVPDELGFQITLPVPVEKAFVGLLDTTQQADTLPAQAIARDGDPRGRALRLHAGSAVILHATAGGFVQAIERDAAHGDVVRPPQRLLPFTVGSDQAVLRSGVVRIEEATGFAYEARWRFTPDGPAPMTILAVISEIEEAGS